MCLDAVEFLRHGLSTLLKCLDLPTQEFALLNTLNRIYV